MRFVVRPGFCSWHVWERIGPNTMRRVDSFTTRREARTLARTLNGKTTCATPKPPTPSDAG